MNKQSQPLANSQFGRYLILKMLGQGAMGSVYLAHDPKLDRNVALKIPKFSTDEDQEILSRFYREARSVASLRHPHLCPVYDVAQHEGTHYITMAYIDGQPLSDFTHQDNLLPPFRVVAAIRKIALGLEVAHRKGVIHRDLKPSNVMFDRERGEPVVMDFGLARYIHSDESQITQLGQLLGTPAFMSPEQVDGDFDQIGPGSDIYSLGVLMYQLLTGHVPFTGRASKVLVMIQTQDPPSPVTFRADLDPALTELCLQAMAKRVVDRFGSMQDFANASAEYLKDARSRTGTHIADSSKPLTTQWVTLGDMETKSVSQGQADATINDKLQKPKSAALDDWGFDAKMQAAVNARIAAGPGVLLVCGPKKSGTTTTTIAVLQSIDAYLYSICTLTELSDSNVAVAGARQFEADSKLDVASNLQRCANRMDPDVIHVDSILDSESASELFCFQEQVVLVSEFAAQDAARGLLKLIQMVPPELVVERLLGILSQKLLRILCKKCKEPFRPNPGLISKFGLPSGIKQLYRPPRSEPDVSGHNQCDTCNGSGYTGCTGVFELIEMSDPLRQLLANDPTDSKIRAIARKGNMPRWQHAAARLVIDGQTSLDEIRRAFQSD